MENFVAAVRTAIDQSNWYSALGMAFVSAEMPRH
jgi:hypothetical protein